MFLGNRALSYYSIYKKIVAIGAHILTKLHFEEQKGKRNFQEFT